MHNMEIEDGENRVVLFSLLSELKDLLAKAKLQNDLSPRGSSLYNNGYIEIFINEAISRVNGGSVDNAGIGRYIESTQKYIDKLNSEIENLNTSNVDTTPGPMFDGKY